MGVRALARNAPLSEDVMAIFDVSRTRKADLAKQKNLAPAERNCPNSFRA
jgi:hypothetical protein